MARKRNEEVSTKQEQVNKSGSISALDDDDDVEGYEDVGEVETLVSGDMKKLSIRRRLEDYMEEKRLREQLQDEFSY